LRGNKVSRKGAKGNKSSRKGAKDDAERKEANQDTTRSGGIFLTGLPDEQDESRES
jgi:hypothetical protein